ncbi:MAG: hypothetical protein ACYDBH_10110 [Acidobacteriaceae bacterium]
MPTPMRVYMVESPSALDAFEETNESATLRALCRLLGHQFTETVVRSTGEFETALKYLTSINPEHIASSQRKWPLCLHISAHGDEKGLDFGAESAPWQYLTKLIASFIKKNDYPGPVFVVVSACGAGQQQVTKELEKLAGKTFAPPAYLFVTAGDEEGYVGWQDAVVAWSIFYREIGCAVPDKKQQIMTIMDKIRIAGAGTLRYFRWDSKSKQYRSYMSKCNEHNHYEHTM